MYKLVSCNEANDEHDDEHRQYAHTYHHKGAICVADKFWDLPETYQAGLLIHEIGHYVVGREGSEEAADVAGSAVSGVDVIRKDSQWGDNLEWVNPKDLGKARKFFKDNLEGYRMARKNPRRIHLTGGVSPKAQRTYEHILASIRKYGKYKGREKEVAARTTRAMLSEGLIRNPSEEEVEEISRGFHGREPMDRFTVEEEETFDEDLAVIGCLVELAITRDDGDTYVKLTFSVPGTPGFREGDEVYVAAPNRHQLEFVGGDQEIANIDEIAKHTDKRLVCIGCLDRLVYLTDKHHLTDSDGTESEYEHHMGRKKWFGFSKKRTGRPEVIYDTVDCHINLVGGSYTITDEGIVD